jgi:undecaprenyl-diphosphatase
MFFFEVIKSIILGVVEGITEWLPISSTGHMILVDEFITLDVSPEFMEMFLFVIQLGAILAVPICFWNRINPFSKRKSEAEKKSTWKMWCKVVVGVIPAAVLGVLLDDFFEEHFYNWLVVALALIIYGIAFLLVENLKAKDGYRVESIDDLTYADAMKIGAFQVLAIVPGTSRSGSTILGGMLSGVSRSVSAEFSFYMAMPVMLGASGIKILKFVLKGYSASPNEIFLLAVGTIVAFAVSLFAIKFLMNFVKRHDFKPFGVYRIVLGFIVIGYFVIKSIV